ncbi:MAG TPA: YraN family protein [Campylobacterales bacterium]|nr:YraN family protein [Campylobacterales bacterium]
MVKHELNNTIIGNRNEALAIDFLVAEGFHIIDTNYYARKLGEIDIIAIYEGVLHFIEVKSGQTDFDPVYNFTPAKQRKVINSAYYYMKSKKVDMVFSIDLIVVRWGEIEFLENVTM